MPIPQPIRWIQKSYNVQNCLYAVNIAFSVHLAEKSLEIVNGLIKSTKSLNFESAKTKIQVVGCYITFTFLEKEQEPDILRHPCSYERKVTEKDTQRGWGSKQWPAVRRIAKLASLTEITVNNIGKYVKDRNLSAYIVRHYC